MTSYAQGSVGFDDPHGVITRTLRFGGNDGFGFDTSPVNADPQLVDPGIDFHIAIVTSPAVDAGSAAATSIVNEDYDADRRWPLGAAIDIGAYEFHH